jgi:phage tail tape-measure protein
MTESVASPHRDTVAFLKMAAAQMRQLAARAPAIEAELDHMARQLDIEANKLASASASASTQTEGTGNRSSLARMASSGLVHTKGLGLSLCSSR